MKSAALLENVIFPDEITHVQAGLRWFKHICRTRYGLSTEEEFIRKYSEEMDTLYGDTPKKLVGPFNKEARLKAGMTEEYYMPFLKPLNSGVKKGN